MADHDSKSSRIAIQLGKSAAPSPHDIKKRARPVHGKRHRAGALQDESDSEDDADNDEKTYGRHQVITSYDLGLDDEKSSRRDGAVARHEQQGDTPSDRKGKTDQKQDDDAKSRGGSTKVDLESQDKPVKWGLTINMRGEGNTKDGKERNSRSRSDRSESEEASGRGKNVKKNIDDEAMDALMGAKAPKRKHPDSDAADREPRPEDYRSIPIDDFGATLLRGFGWDGKLRGKIKEVNRHANLTGLGAKDTKGAEDLGSWNQKTGKDSRPVRLDDYQREDNKKRQRMDDRYGDSYKRERERERERERDRHRDRR